MAKLFIALLGIISVVIILYFTVPEFQNYLQRETGHVLPTSTSQTTVYRWQDAQGQWQVSDQPPKPGIPYETIEYPSDANIIPAEQLTGKKTD